MVSSVAIIYFALVTKMAWTKSLEANEQKGQEVYGEKVLTPPGSSAETAENEYSDGASVNTGKPHYEVSVSFARPQKYMKQNYAKFWAFQRASENAFKIVL